MRPVELMILLELNTCANGANIPHVWNSHEGKLIRQQFDADGISEGSFLTAKGQSLLNRILDAGDEDQFIAGIRAAEKLIIQAIYERDHDADIEKIFIIEGEE